MFHGTYSHRLIIIVDFDFLQATYNWTVFLNPRSEHTLVSRTFEIVSRWVWGFGMSFLGKAYHLLSVFCGYISVPKTD